MTVLCAQRTENAVVFSKFNYYVLDSECILCQVY